MRLTSWIVAAVLLAVLAYPLGWLLVCDLQPLRVAQQYLRADLQVQQAVGKVEKVALDPIGSALPGLGLNNQARLKLRLWGTKGSATAYVELSRENQWRVATATLTVEQRAAIQLR